MPVLSKAAGAALALGLLTMAAPDAAAQPLSIYQVQYTTNADGSSDYDGQVIDCAGGICVGKFPGFRPRLILQDPDHPDGWGGIQVKDWTNGDLYDNVNIGDRITLTNMLVEEHRGTTFLQWQIAYDPQFARVSQSNPLPPPIVVSVSQIPAPLKDSFDNWYVENHEAELYESMRLVVRDVTVTAKDLGKAVDNYNLQTPGSHDCWAADYMNQDVGPWGYHEFVAVGQHFCAVAGVFEQYTRLADGWDYYQLITLDTVDLAICGDGDSDGEVDCDDVPCFRERLIGPLCDGVPGGCDPPAWTQPPADLPLQHCLMMDLDYDGDVDLLDFAGLQVLLGAP